MKRSKEQSVILITNTETEYAPHNVVYLALPDGLTYNFRYKKEQIPFIYSLQIEDRAQWLRGKKGALLLREKQTGRFIPLRTFIIRDASERGDAMYLELQFFAVAKFEIESREPDNASKNDALKYQYSSRFEKTLPAPHNSRPGELYARNLMYTTKEPFNDVFISIKSSESDSLQYWSNLAYLLSTIEGFRTVSFYKITGILKMESIVHLLRFNKGFHNFVYKRFCILRSKRLRDSRIGYKLVGNRNYSLELIQEMPFRDRGSDQTVLLSVNSNPQQLIFMESKAVIDSGNDLLKFMFSTVTQETTPTSSYITIPMVVQSSNNDAEVGNHLLSAQIPLSIQWSKLSFLIRKVMPPVAFLSSISLWLFAKELGSSDGGILFDFGFTEEAIRYVSIFLMALAFQSWSSFVRIFKVDS